MSNTREILEKVTISVAIMAVPVGLFVCALCSYALSVKHGFPLTVIEFLLLGWVVTMSLVGGGYGVLFIRNTWRQKNEHP